MSAEELMLLNCGVGEDRVPWTARRSNQSILTEISPGISLEGMMLKLKLQYFGHLMRRVDSLEKTLVLGGTGGRRRRGRQRIRWLDGTGCLVHSHVSHITVYITLPWGTLHRLAALYLTSLTDLFASLSPCAHQLPGTPGAHRELGFSSNVH